MEMPSFVAAGMEIIGWALVHFIWQCSLLGLLYAIARKVVSRGEARYRLGMMTLFMLAICPLLTIWQMLRVLLPSVDTTTGSVTSDLVGAGLVANATPSAGIAMNALLPWLVLVWLLGVCILSLRAWRQWRGLNALVGKAESLPFWQSCVTDMAKRFGLSRHVRVLCSHDIDTPALIGWLKPVIVLPMAVTLNFPATQIELIFAHELSHLRRWDPLANLFQVMLETLHFYHPVVHWISQDVRNEREICCDRLAIAITGGSRHQFATALAELGGLQEQRGMLLLPANGGVLLDRVQHIMLPDHGGARVGKSARFAAMLLAAVLVATMVRLEWTQAQIQQSLSASLQRLNTIFEHQRLPLERSVGTFHLSDLVPQRVKVLRPVAPGTSHLAQIDSASLLPAVTIAVGAIALPRPVQVQILDLVHSHNELPIRIANQASALAAPSPVLIRRPIYPQDAVIGGVEGKVTVEFNIASDGSVQNLSVINAKPAGVFDQAAERAMRGWKYAVSEGVSPQRLYRQVFAFSLNASRAMGPVSTNMPVGTEVLARVGCQTPTGTHICRWPESNESKRLAEPQP